MEIDSKQASDRSHRRRRRNAAAERQLAAGKNVDRRKIFGNLIQSFSISCYNPHQGSYFFFYERSLFLISTMSSIGFEKYYQPLETVQAYSNVELLHCRKIS
ncbi:hypothetical protein NPIL_324391 [Nephila pilipes]|uniref:Uncharacterized protein n=1 Tax=Nephila pilipes TaxID=299642 RepID=A0A8X6UB57_NEPPI|nr:hypothetical protein NPIL_324391 [Nephila pilipes]